MPTATLALDEAVDLARTGDIWLFRGHTPADRAIQLATNSPVNHVGMAVVIGDLPPLMWHAELGRSLPDVWSGRRQRGVQLHVLCRRGHDLGEPVRPAGLGAAAEPRGDAGDGGRGPAGDRPAGRDAVPVDGRPGVPRLTGRLPSLRRPLAAADGDGEGGGAAGLETAYCAEVLAVTYQAMGLLPGGRRQGWYDAGRFWSGDDLRLDGGYSLGGELAVRVPPGALSAKDVTNHH